MQKIKEILIQCELIIWVAYSKFRLSVFLVKVFASVVVVILNYFFFKIDYI